jgi:hypothetical protein
MAPGAAPASVSTPTSKRPRITLKHNTADERATQHQLERLFDEHDLSPWFFTDAVEIDEQAVPHSHPLLTLHTRHLKDDLLLLATYIHEQSHHYCQNLGEKTVTAMREVETVFPNMPVGYPDGANDKFGSYEHLSCVIPFEHDGLIDLVGELKARQVMEFWSHDHYRVLYRTYLDNRREIWPILKKSGLSPPTEVGAR